MIAVDTNLLVYRADGQWHMPAKAALRELAEGSLLWGIPSPCLSEFLAVVTGFKLPILATPLEQALN